MLYTLVSKLTAGTDADVWDIEPAVFVVKVAGATVFVYWEPDFSGQGKPNPHEIFLVGDAIEVRCRHTELDMDAISSHVTLYVVPSSVSRANF